MIFDNLKKRCLRDADGDFWQGGDINQKTESRNNTVTLVAISVLLLASFGLYQYTRPPTPVQEDNHEPVELGVIIEQGFVEKDNQSALSWQQNTLSSLEKIADLPQSIAAHKEDTQRRIEQAKAKIARLVEDQIHEEFREKEAQLHTRIDELEQRTQGALNTEEYNTVHTQETINRSETFGRHKLPRDPFPPPRATPI